VIDDPGTAKPASLAAENQRLRSQLSALSARQTQLAYRLERIENSIVFRTLRAMGAPARRAAWAMRRVRSLFVFDAAHADPAYTSWIRAVDRNAGPEAVSKAKISIILIGDSPNAEETLHSIGEQTHAALEIRTIRSSSEVRAAVEQSEAEYIVFAEPGVILRPFALSAMAAAADAGSSVGRSDVVHCDWDHVDPRGSRHTPRFTPEYSPELLSHTLYWGSCFLARRSTVHEVAWPADGEFSLHQLALALSARAGRIERIPRILWHQRAKWPVAAYPSDGAPVANFDVVEKASIVICTRNPQRIERCLRLLAPQSESRPEIIVLMHGAGPGSELERIVSRYNGIAVPYDGGFDFAHMNRLAARAASRDVLVFMNDDVYPIAPDWLPRMVAKATQPVIGAVGALLSYPSGAIQHAGIVVGGFPGPTNIGSIDRIQRYWPWLAMSRDVSAVTGACLAIRREVWDELGGFDSRFPVNYNDVDLCFRARERGYRVVLESMASLVHEESQTRLPVVRPEELEQFTELWSELQIRPDPFFHPALTLVAQDIQLVPPRQCR